MVQIYTTFSSAGSRKAIFWLEEHNVKYVEKNISRVKISTKEVVEILKRTENGFDDILSKRSKIYIQNKDKIDNMKFTEMVQFIQENPTVIKRPILIAEDRFLIGYSEDDITIFKR